LKVRALIFPANAEAKLHTHRRNESKAKDVFIKDLHGNCKQSMKKGGKNGLKMDLSEGTNI